MSAYGPLLAALVALLVGLTVGKAWERYKLRGGTWIYCRRARQSPHYILGLNFLVANQIDLAIDALTRAASVDPDALEVHMILGNLYREKGQVGKAITAHQSLLQRAQSQQDRTCLRAPLPGARLQAWRLRRSGARSVQRSAAPRRDQRIRARSTSRSCTRNSINGRRPTTRGSVSTNSRPLNRGRKARRFSPSSKMRSGSRPCGGRTIRKRSAASRPRSISMPAPCRRT